MGDVPGHVAEPCCRWETERTHGFVGTCKPVSYLDGSVYTSDDI